jgi:hypothetical protein
MEPVTVHSAVGDEGVLHLDIPIGMAAATKAVKVTVEPLLFTEPTNESWQDFVRRTAGAWQGDFERPDYSPQFPTSPT